MDDKLKQEAIDAIKNECFSGDTEIDHSMADGILCELLEKLGYSEVVEEYHKVDKWFA